MKDNRARELRRTLRAIDELLRGERNQLRELRARIAALMAQRGQAIAEVAEHRKMVKAERDLARDRLEMNIMMRVNQHMTTPQIARALRRTEAQVSRVIKDFRKAEESGTTPHGTSPTFGVHRHTSRRPDPPLQREGGSIDDNGN